jgi:hypothetical protein
MNHARLLSDVFDSLVTASAALHRANIITNRLRDGLVRKNMAPMITSSVLSQCIVAAIRLVHESMGNARSLEEELEKYEAVANTVDP